MMGGQLPYETVAQGRNAANTHDHSVRDETSKLGEFRDISKNSHHGTIRFHPEDSAQVREPPRQGGGEDFSRSFGA